MVVNRTDLLLYRLGGSLTNENVVFSSYVANNCLVEFVARNFGGAGNDHTAKRQNGYVGGSATDINYHIANGGVNVQACTNSRGNGFFNQICLLRTRFACGIAYGFFFNLGNTRGNADHYVGLEKKISASATNEVLNHFERDLVLADNTVTQGTNSYNIAGRSAKHLLCLNTNLENTVGVGINRYYRWLLNHNSLALHVNKNGCGAEVNANVATELELLDKGFCTFQKALTCALFGATCRVLANIHRFFCLFRLFHEQDLLPFCGSSS